jgi:hypothetical protein
MEAGRQNRHPHRAGAGDLSDLEAGRQDGHPHRATAGDLRPRGPAAGSGCPNSAPGPSPRSVPCQVSERTPRGYWLCVRCGPAKPSARPSRLLASMTVDPRTTESARAVERERGRDRPVAGFHRHRSTELKQVRSTQLQQHRSTQLHSFHHRSNLTTKYFTPLSRSPLLARSHNDLPHR